VLETWGAEVDLLDDDQLRDPGDYHVVFIVQPVEALDQALVEDLFRYMEQGGSLVVVGEHTDLHNILSSVNSLLAPSGIRLKDDSAMPTLVGWKWAYNQKYHLSSLTAGLRNSNQLGVSIGASLDQDFPAYPLVSGVLAFSDKGDPDNPRGKLGNSRYDYTERYGSVPLLSAQPVGSGMLVVMGDKSPIMSLNSPQVWPFYLNLVGRLAGHSSLLNGRVLLGLCVLILVAAGVFAVTRTSPLQAMALAAGLLLVFSLNELRVTEPPLPDGDRSDIGWIDFSHQPNWMHAPDLDWSVMSLLLWLYRTDVLPLYHHTLRTEDLAGARFFLVAGSARPYSRGECRRLEDYVEQGGRLVIAGDYRRREGLGRLLNIFGMDLGSMPLGPAPESIDAQGGSVGFKFYEAWPVLCTAGEMDTLVSCWDYPVIARKQLGRGSVTVVGDERFFSRWSLEGGSRKGKVRGLGTRFTRRDGKRRDKPATKMKKREYMAEHFPVEKRAQRQSPAKTTPAEIANRNRMVAELLGTAYVPPPPPETREAPAQPRRRRPAGRAGQ